MYRVFETEKFEKECRKKLTKTEVIELRKFQNILKVNPKLGDTLRVPYVREKKLSGKRAYFIVNDKVKGILFVAISYKKDQRETINHIFDIFEELNDTIKNMVKN